LSAEVKVLPFRFSLRVILGAVAVAALAAAEPSAARITAQAVAAATDARAAHDVVPDRYLEHVRFLASDELQGRGNGTEGLERAAEYIAGQFARAGLKPGGDGGSYFQTFDLPAGRQDPGATLTTARNVVGLVPGSGGSDEAVIVGAHYDHLGTGRHGSRAPDARGEVHNGADDNASGTAALLEIARLAAAGAEAPLARALVFVAFAGEEIGLLGSRRYVERPPVPLDRTIAMINLDMIGRPDGRLLLSGLEHAPSLEADLRAAREAAGSRLRIERFREGGSAGSSDDASFSRRRIPAIAFFSGFHADYHRPTDDWEKLDLDGAVEVTRLAWAFTRQIAARAGRPAFEPRE
jgi:hypothetical protein